jgi:predicted Zn-dependent peptidase
MEYQSYTLKNGLRIVHKPSDSHVSYCGFIINAGTRDENTDEHGMAHFIEHMLFKGTEKRKSYHIINRMESVGGEINAYTNKEETVIYSIFLEEHFNRAFELLSDLTFHSVFPQQEIEKEIDVIIDEIHSYEDSPSELIYDEFENLVFSGSQLGHNILGEPETLESFNTDKAKLFVNKFYQPSNIVFFSLGKTDFKKIVKQAEKYISDIECRETNYKRPNISSSNKLDKVIDKDTSQAHALIGSRCYDLHNPKRKVLHLLNNILGGPGMNSRLNISLREKRGYVYNVESNMTSYTDTGLFSIYFGCDKKNVDKCLKLTYSELGKLRDTKLTSSQLNAAKKQLIGQIGISSDNHENLSLGLGKSFLHYGHFNSMDETISKIESISSSDILDVANEVLDEKNLFSLIYK